MVKDEYLHLNYGQEWLKENLSICKEELMEEFMIAYQDTLMEIGLDNREIARMAMAAIV